MLPLPFTLGLLGFALLALGAAPGVSLMHRALALSLGASGTALCSFYLARRLGYAPEDWVVRGPAALRPVLRLLLLPYAAVAWLVLFFARALSREAAFDRIGEGLYVGALPFPWARAGLRREGITAVLNLCLEFPPLSKSAGYRPMLDGIAPRREHLEEAVGWILERRRAGARVLVHCAQGHGRSACVAAAVLLSLGEAGSVDEAIGRLRAARPSVCLRADHRRVLEAWRGAVADAR